MTSSLLHFLQGERKRSAGVNISDLMLAGHSAIKTRLNDTDNPFLHSRAPVDGIAFFLFVGLGFWGVLWFVFGGGGGFFWSDWF